MPDHRKLATDRIETEILERGERLSSIDELMRLFDVGEHTARRAMDELKAEGLAVTRRGDGTFIREVRPMLRLVFGESMPGQPFWPINSDREMNCAYDCPPEENAIAWT